jgi:hypothetical protein
MRYLSKEPFLVPTSNGKLSQIEYEVRVGKRCDNCKELWKDCVCYIQDTEGQCKN